ncbi:unnamed protein product [Schistosoma turkestanicum]|nr:unnamed protein product [Schistosoma turkestanicum]
MMQLWCLCFLATFAIVSNVSAFNCTQQAKVILFNVDGFRYDLLDMAKQRNVNISAFDKIRQYGVYIQGIKSVFPTLQYPTKYSMLTGLYPESHGIVADQFYDPILDVTIKAGLSDAGIYNVGGEPIWITNQLHGYKSGVIGWSGIGAKVKSLSPTLLESSFKELKEYFDILMDWFQNENITLAVVNYDYLGETSKSYGAEDNFVFEAIKTINVGLEHLLTLINERPWLSHCLNLIISSGHGMINGNGDKLIYLDDYLKPIEYTTTDEEIGAVYSLWPKSGSTPESLYSKLKDKHRNLKVYRKNEIPAHLFYKSNVRIGPIVLIADFGWTIVVDRLFVQTS